VSWPEEQPFSTTLVVDCPVAWPFHDIGQLHSEPTRYKSLPHELHSVTT